MLRTGLTTVLTLVLAASASAQDTDGDGMPDTFDNCTEVPNGPLVPDLGGNSLLDTDGDGFGNACDADLNDSLFVDAVDLDHFKSAFFASGPGQDADLNGDGSVDFLDLGAMSALYLKPPGPTCCPPEQKLITDVLVADQGTPIPGGYVPLTYGETTSPGVWTSPSDVNANIGGSTTSIYVLYEDVALTSDTPVLTEVRVQQWPHWNGPFPGGAYCPEGWQPARGKSPSGALTTGTDGDCNRIGLCVKMEPVRDATPTTNLSLSYAGSSGGLSCPAEADAEGETAPRSLISSDIHAGCGGDYVRVCGYSVPEAARQFITDVWVQNGEFGPVGYSPVTWSAATLPGTVLPAADVNKGIGGDTVGIFVKYEPLSPDSDTPVLTDVLVRQWAHWDPPFQGGAYCPPGWEQPSGGKSPSGALTTGTDGACNRIGLCIKKEPHSAINESRTATPMTNLGLSGTSSYWRATCPRQADGSGVSAYRSRLSSDIHSGCGDDFWVRVCGYSPKADPPALDLNALAERYAPNWRFYPGEPQFPMDLETHLTDAVQHSAGGLSYSALRVCDSEGWRLYYDWSHPGDRTGRRFGTSDGGTAYAFVAESPRGYDIHYFVYYVYNFGDPLGFTTAYDHWGDWERATVHLEWVDGVLEPRSLTTEAHGNPWENSWSGGEVWFSAGGDHPDVFVAEESHGTYPNTSHERGIFDSSPSSDSANRTCTDSNPHPLCDFVAGDGEHAVLPVYTIRVDGLFDESATSFVALDQNGDARGDQPGWLQTDYTCPNPGDIDGAEGAIFRWGNDSHDGGVRTPLVKDSLGW